MEIVYRAAAIYFFLWFITRVVGKRELGQMSAFELVLLVTMGDLIQQGVTQEDYSITGAMLAVGTFALLIVLFAYLSWRFPRSRPALEGLPCDRRPGRRAAPGPHALRTAGRHRAVRGAAPAGHRRPAQGQDRFPGA